MYIFCFVLTLYVGCECLFTLEYPSCLLVMFMPLFLFLFFILEVSLSCSFVKTMLLWSISQYLKPCIVNVLHCFWLKKKNLTTLVRVLYLYASISFSFFSFFFSLLNLSYGFPYLFALLSDLIGKKNCQLFSACLQHIKKHVPLHNFFILIYLTKMKQCY